MVLQLLDPEGKKVQKWKSMSSFTRTLFHQMVNFAVEGTTLLPGSPISVSFEGMRWTFQVSNIEAPDQKEESKDIAALQADLIDSTNLSGSSSPDHVKFILMYRISKLTQVTMLFSEEEQTPEKEGKHDAETYQDAKDPDNRREDAWKSVGGLQKEIDAIRDTIELPLVKPELFEAYGVRPPKGVLLYGPPGTGKTSLAKAAAKALGCHIVMVSGPELISRYSGESEETLRKIFEEASLKQPSLIIMDEIDALCVKRDEASSAVEQSIVSTLLALMDGVQTSKKVVVLACTNRPHALDPAVRRPGRLDREIEIGVPSEEGRKDILRVLLSQLPHCLPDSAVASVARNAHGFVGADLAMVCKEAALRALTRHSSQRNQAHEKGSTEGQPCIKEEDLLEAFTQVRPSQLREVAVEVPKVKWEDVGGMDDVKQILKEVVEWPLNFPEAFQRMGISPPKGVLLYGPPGCSKTLMARALATESGMNFLAVKGPELLSKWLGESERALQALFRRARSAAPTIIFFDEVDAIASRRGSDNAGATERMLTQMLSELDGIQPLKRVIVVAATNRPDILDPALCRPGRIDRMVYVPPPDFDSRREILRISVRNIPCSSDTDLQRLAERTEGYSGAEIVAFCKEAAMCAIEENKHAQEIEARHFDTALKRKNSQITPAMIDFYKNFKTSSLR